MPPPRRRSGLASYTLGQVPTATRQELYVLYSAVLEEHARVRSALYQAQLGRRISDEAAAEITLQLTNLEGELSRIEGDVSVVTEAQARTLRLRLLEMQNTVLPDLRSRLGGGLLSEEGILLRGGGWTLVALAAVGAAAAFLWWYSKQP